IFSDGDRLRILVPVGDNRTIALQVRGALMPIGQSMEMRSITPTKVPLFGDFATNFSRNTRPLGLDDRRRPSEIKRCTRSAVWQEGCSMTRRRNKPNPNAHLDGACFDPRLYRWS